MKQPISAMANSQAPHKDTENLKLALSVLNASLKASNNLLQQLLTTQININRKVNPNSKSGKVIRCLKAMK